MPSKTPTLTLLTAAALLASTATGAREPGIDPVTGVAIGGYSPVSYFEEGVPERGSPRHTATFEGRTYHFTSAAQVRRFEADPEAYAPVFPDHCPYHLALGRTVAIDPTNVKILDGQLLLFHRSEEMDSLARWNRQEDQIDLLERARGNYRGLRF